MALRTRLSTTRAGGTEAWFATASTGETFCSAAGKHHDLSHAVGLHEITDSPQGSKDMAGRPGVTLYRDS